MFQLFFFISIVTSYFAASGCLSEIVSQENLTNFHTIFRETEVELVFVKPNYYLSSFINISDKINVTLRSANQTAKVQCGKGAALAFSHVIVVKISNIEFVDCGAESNNKISAIAILDCNTVEISYVSVTSTCNTGLYMVNVSESITAAFINISFKNNCLNAGEQSSQSTGLYIVAKSVDSANYLFKNCTFRSIGGKNCPQGEWFSAKSKYSNCSDTVGGGMTILIRDNTKNLKIEIISSIFDSNIAAFGGGLSVSFMNASDNNTLNVINTSFERNCAKWKGGGAYLSYMLEEDMVSNKIIFYGCNFKGNKAVNGGATYFSAYSQYSNCKGSNDIIFEDCTWTENEAILGSAVHTELADRLYTLTEKGARPEPFFSNCCFANNVVRYNSQNEDPSHSIKIFGKGGIFSNEMDIKLKGIMEFISNNGSAIFLVSSTLKIEDSNTTFNNNSGYNGGGIALLRNSVIHLVDNAYVIFQNNTASSFGGAIYHETYNDPFESGIHRCFIKCTAANKTENMTLVKFVNNSIKREKRKNSPNLRGLSIFSYSLTPCINNYGIHADNIETVLKNAANIEMEDYLNESDVSTLPSRFKHVENIPKYFFPGKETNLSIVVEDDTNTSVSQVTYSAVLQKISGSIVVDPAYEFVSNNIIKLNGKPHDSATLHITITNRPDYQLSFDVSLRDCPVGFISNYNRCECSGKIYLGIKSCNLTEYTAILIQGYWLGYVNKFVRTSTCPLGFCKVETGRSDVLLPQDRSKLSNVLCNNNRHGRVCSLCSENNSLFYHTPGNAYCDSNSKCHLGIFFYILSEIIPVTIFFLIILLFDVNLTSGALCGFLFYVQSINTLEITAGSFITFPKLADGLLIFLRFLTSMFNLEFFLLPKFAFCLFKNANYLHWLLFSYITIFYALVLIIITVVLVNLSPKYFTKFTQKKGYKTKSFIHGLSSFLVICFARTTKTSLQILDPATLFEEQGKPKGYAVFYHGEYDYFGPEHKPFAFLAIVTLVLTSIPVLLLLMYPSCYQLFACIKLDQTKFFEVLCKVFPLEKLRPFFDSFQSTFKDKHRYFAGLFFVYRFSTLLINNVSNMFTIFLYALEVHYLLILTIHGIIHPHKEHWHNQIDIAILSLLAILNGITAYNYHLRVHSYLTHKRTIEILSTIQVLLAYLPLLYITLFFAKQLKQKFDVKCNRSFKKMDSLMEETTNNSILELLDQQQIEDNEEENNSFKSLYFKKSEET